MFKLFILGIVVGAAAACGLLYCLPVVDQHRETSFVSVEPNGRNLETFHVNLPEDRVVARNAGAEIDVPAGTHWPAAAVVKDARVELFKIRDRNDAVVGVASRMSGPVAAQGSVIEWTLHLPARGTMYVAMLQAAGTDGLRDGTLRTGTGEFAARQGSVSERLVAAAEPAGEEPGAEGRIELQALLAGIASSIE